MNARDIFVDPRRGQSGRQRCGLGFYFLAAAVFFLLGAGGASGEQKRILVLNSYDPGYEWTAGMMAGVEVVLARAKEDIRVHIEYMDTKRYHSEEYLVRILEDVLTHKLAGLSFDLVLVSDNDAFSFVVKHRRDLFSDVPVVFCGLNNYQPSMIAGLGGVTGVAEVTSVRGTLQVALDFHPETEEIIVICNTQEGTGRLTKERVLSYLPEFQAKVRFSFWDNLPIDVLTARLASLSPGQLVLVSSFVTSERGEVLPLAESARRMRQASTVPIYSLWESNLGHGIVGGKLISAHHQGTLAGELALRVLSGESADEIPVISNDANQYLFDYNELKRFGVDFTRLPANSQVINQPPSFYQISKESFWLAIALASGMFAAMVALLHNIHSRKTHARALREQSWLQQTLIDAIPLPIYYKDSGGHYLGCNVAGEKFFGQSRMAIVGKTVHDLFPSVQAQLYQESDLTLLKQGGIHVFEGLMTVAGGITQDVLFHKAAYYRSDGTFAGVVGSILDITERKEAERSLQHALTDARNAREKIEAIITSMAEGLIVTDLDRKILLINPQAEMMLGVTGLIVSGRMLNEVIAIPALQAHFAGIHGGTHEVFFAEISLPDKSRDSVVILHARSSLVRQKDGAETGIITTLRDVTSERALDRMKNEFISTAAHELRTPLTSVLGFSQVLLQQEQYGITDRGQQMELLGHISEKAEHLAQIVDDLLDLSRIQAGLKIPLKKSLCPIKSLIDKVVLSCQKIVRGHHFEICLPPHPREICLDPKKMVQVFENLVSNAVKYSPEGGLVQILGELTGGLYQISVADQGIGMTEEECGRVFENFFRVDASNAAIEGLGLGMTITRNIIEAHGGEIWLESKKGEGTTVFFNLPIEEPCDGTLIGRDREKRGVGCEENPYC